jgi:hypothetical protein
MKVLYCTYDDEFKSEARDRSPGHVAAPGGQSPLEAVKGARRVSPSAWSGEIPSSSQSSSMGFRSRMSGLHTSSSIRSRPGWMHLPRIPDRCDGVLRQRRRSRSAVVHRGAPERNFWCLHKRANRVGLSRCLRVVAADRPFPDPICNCPTGEAGQACTGQSECLSACVAPLTIAHDCSDV